MTHSKLDEIFQKLDKRIVNGIAISIARDEVFDTDNILAEAKSDIKLLMLTIYKEALEAGSVAEMSDKFRKRVEAL